MKLKAVGSSETLSSVHDITWCHNPKNHNPSSYHWKLQTFYSFTCHMDVKLGLTLRKCLCDSNFTSLLEYYNSPDWGQQVMTSMLSTQCPVCNQIGHICPKGPNTAWCTDLQLLYIANRGLLLHMLLTGWRQALHLSPEPTWVSSSDPGKPSYDAV